MLPGVSVCPPDPRTAPGRCGGVPEGRCWRRPPPSWLRGCRHCRLTLTPGCGGPRRKAWLSSYSRVQGEFYWWCVLLFVLLNANVAIYFCLSALVWFGHVDIQRVWYLMDMIEKPFSPTFINYLMFTFKLAGWFIFESHKCNFSGWIVFLLYAAM